jgi:hypothetical protein
MPNTVTYTVTRSNNLNGAATLSYSVVGTGNGPALASDFQSGTLPSGTVSFADQDETKTVTLTFAANAVPGRTFAIRISDPSTGVIQTGAVAGVVPGAIFNIA